METNASSPAAKFIAKNFGLGRRPCVKCAMLSAGDYTRDDLASRYTAREIRTFLVAHHVVIDNCKEKADLIELAMTLSHSPDRSHDRDAEHMRRIAQLKVGPLLNTSCYKL